MITARATTDEKGRQVTGSHRIDPVPMYATINIKKTPEPKKWIKGVFGDLLSEQLYRFSLLADYVTVKKHPDLRTPCEYGISGRIRWLKIDGETYWSRGSVIYDHCSYYKDDQE